MNTSPYGYDTGLYPENLNQGHYASAPGPDQTFQDFCTPETGHRQAHVSDSGSYGAYGDPYASNRGPYWAYGDPRAANTGSYDAPRDAYAPNTGSYQTYHVPHASDTGQYSGYRGPHVSETRPYVQCQSLPSSSPPTNSTYPYPSPSHIGLHSGASQPPEYGHNWQPRSNFSQPSPAYRAPESSSSQAPEKQRYQPSSGVRRDGNTLTAEKSAAGARGGDARADASNAMPLSNFVRALISMSRSD